MINTVFVSSSQIAHLARLAGWYPFPWSVMVSHLSAPEPSRGDLEALAAKGLLVGEDETRVNTAVAVALAAVCEPDQQIEIALPGIEPLYLCRAGTVTVGWHGRVDGGIALSFPLTFPDRHRLLSDLLDAETGTDGVETLQLTASASELEILIALGEHALGDGLSTVDELVQGVLGGDRTTTSESLTEAISRLISSDLIDRHGDSLALAGPARMFGQSLRYGFLVKRIRMPDPVEPVVIDALHVYRGDRGLVAVRPVGADVVECQQVNRRQLADMILTLTLDDCELADLTAT